MKSIIRTLIALTGALVVIACGGGGSGTAAAHPMSGIYRATYNRAAGDILLEVRSDGSIEVAVNDDTLGSFTGTGMIGTDGHVTASATFNGQTLNLTGQISGNGNQRTFTGSLTGAFTLNFNGGFVGSNSENPFQGQYSGTFGGGGTGTWSATVDASGNIVGQAAGGGDTFAAVGKVSNVGKGSFTGSGAGSGITFTFTGQFRLVGATGASANGSWQSSTPATGTFTGSRQ